MKRYTFFPGQKKAVERKCKQWETKRKEKEAEEKKDKRENSTGKSWPSETKEGE